MNNEDIKQLVEKIEALESKLAFQEDTIDQLNQEITSINLDNALFKRQLALLAEKLKSQKGSLVASEAEETPPPHY